MYILGILYYKKWFPSSHHQLNQNWEIQAPQLYPPKNTLKIKTATWAYNKAKRSLGDRKPLKTINSSVLVYTRKNTNVNNYNSDNQWDETCFS